MVGICICYTKTIIFKTLFFSNTKWYYAGRNSGWWEYDVTSTKIIEKAWRDKKSSVVLAIVGNTYMIDFTTMKQQSLMNGGGGLKRRISRGSKGLRLIKGVAGKKKTSCHPMVTRSKAKSVWTVFFTIKNYKFLKIEHKFYF